MRVTSQRGVSAVEIVLVASIFVIIAALVYVFYTNMIAGDASNSTQTSQVDETAEPTADDVKPVEDEKDLEELAAQLDEASVEDEAGTDAQQQASLE